MIFKIYYHPICPFSRLLRCILFEKKITAELIQEPFWERRIEFLQINPLCQTPTIIHQNSKYPISGMWAVLEFLEEIFEGDSILGDNLEIRANNRYLLDWFCNKFFNEITKYILREKIIKTMLRSGAPNSKFIIAAKKNLSYHMEYIEYLLGENRYITNDIFSNIVDFAAATQLSVLDYVGDVFWKQDSRIKIWYSLMKSKQSFYSILKENIHGITPIPHYRDPDF